MNDKGQIWIYSIAVIFVLLVLFFFLGSYMEMREENKNVKEIQASLEYSRTMFNLYEGYYEACKLELRGLQNATPN